jgi:hypothetical protein
MTINVIQRNGNVNGKKLEHFIKKYWQALCPIPKNSNPAWDNNGSKDGPFNNNVGEDLYMLSFSRSPLIPGTNIPAAPAKRNIKIPADKGLFIPVVSVLVSECETSESLIPTAEKDQTSVIQNSVELILDGTSFNHNNYRFNPADIDTFQVNFPPPADSIFKITSSGSCDAVAAGRYIWTEPLSPGEQHTVSFKGKLSCRSTPPPRCIDEEYNEDITYNITVQ